MIIKNYDVMGENDDCKFLELIFDKRKNSGYIRLDCGKAMREQFI